MSKLERPFERRRAVMTKLGVACASIVLAFVALEIGLRAAGFTHLPRELAPIVWKAGDDGVETESFHQRSVRQLWQPKPGATLPWGDGERVNDMGYRGPVLSDEKRAGVLRIATLGDSSTFGFGVRYEQSWSAQLARELAQRGIDAEVLDAGVIGSTIEQGLERYDELVRSTHPDVVIAAYGAVNECFDTEGLSDRDKIDARAKQLEPANVLLRAQRDLRSVQLAGWLADQLREPPTKAAQRKARKLARTLKRDLEFGAVDWPGVRRVAPERFEQCIAELAERVRGDGARLLIVSMPRKATHERDWPILVRYTEAVERAAPRLGLPLCDFNGSVRRQLAAGAAWEDFFLDAFHPSPAGHEWLARELAQLVVETRTSSLR